MKNTRYNPVILNGILFLFILYLVNLIVKNKQNVELIEPLQFYHNDFKPSFNTHNIEYNRKNKEFMYKKNIISKFNLNSKNSKYIMNNKGRTNSFLKNNNISVPNEIIFNKEKYNNKQNSIEEIIKEVNNKLNYPVVIKPTDQSNSIDVFINIKNDYELKNKLEQLSKKYDELIIQEFIKGNLYRILIINNKIIDIIVRPLPFVIGTGKHTLQELIDIKNNQQIKEGNYPTKKLNIKFIKSQGFNISNNNIIPKDKYIYLTNIPTYHNGSNPQRINIKKVHKDNIKLFLTTVNLLDASISGIDFISTDISKSYKNNNRNNNMDKNTSKIIEINSGPDYIFHKNIKPTKNIANLIVTEIKNILDKRIVET
jgi:glutathione synthase/RimK-type ligase-like ATP-grasp enzyme